MDVDLADMDVAGVDLARARGLIALFTDFGIAGPYVGQVELRLSDAAPEQRVVRLVCDAPAFNPKASAYLLAGLVSDLPPQTVVVAVVDPEVGRERPALVVRTQSHWFVGPGNGLLRMVAAHASTYEVWEIDWRPERLAPTFHGRDLFALVGAQLARGDAPPGPRLSQAQAEKLMGGVGWPEDLPELIYRDPYGNMMSGLRVTSISGSESEPGAEPGAELVVEAKGVRFRRVRTFGDGAPHEAICYENSIGLLELAVNLGSAADSLRLEVGTPLKLLNRG